MQKIIYYVTKSIRNRHRGGGITFLVHVMLPNHERRQFPRVSLTHATVEVYDTAGRLDEPELCFIINVSENGMLLMADCQAGNFPENERVRLTFTLPDNDIIIRTDAIIVHAQESELSQYLGIQFIHIGNSEQRYLREFVAASLRAPL